jgi:hypothetical protein
MASTDAEARMIARTREFTTQQLCAALGMLDRQRLSRDEHLVRTTIIDVLCERHPEADAAFDRWAGQDENTETAIKAITTAALAAAR